MKKVILLVGDSGSGKDFILSVINEYESIQIVKRFSSRSARKVEENSLSSTFSVPVNDIKNMDYYYEGIEPGNWYGIRKIDLDNVLESGKSPVVICSNYENYLKMFRDYSGNVIPFFIYRGYEDTQLEKWRDSLIARGSSLSEINARENKRDKYFRELFVEHHKEYGSNVILNYYDITTKEEIKLQLEGLCKKNNIDIQRIKRMELNKK